MSIWDVMVDGFVLPKCADGHRHWSPQPVCPVCLGPWSWAPASGAGSVYSFTVVHRAPRADLTTPYVVAAIDLDEGVVMLSNVVDVSADKIESGLRVDVLLRDGLPVFRPA